MRADNTHHLLAAAHARADRTRNQALAALQRMHAAGAAINFDTVAAEAGVSRSWLYSQADLRAEIQRLRSSRPSPSDPRPTPQRQRASDSSLLRRLEVANEQLQRLRAENHELRQALAAALGTQRSARVNGPAPPRDTPEMQHEQTR